MNRRTVIAGSSVVLLSNVAGCMLLSESAGDSSVVRVDNRTETALTGIVTIAPFDEVENSSDAQPRNTTPPDAPTRVQKWEYEVEPDGSETSGELITEPGEYYVDVEGERGETDSRNVSFYSTGNGEDVGGGQIVITLYDRAEHTLISIGQETLD